MLTLDGLAARMARNLSSIEIQDTARIAIALSGGGDSTALALMARDHFGAIGQAGRLLAVTVNHGLRSESAEEADRVGQLCAELGIAHRIRRWEGDKPATGLQAAARAARYRLLAETVDEAGGGIVLTGHTRDDQLETVAMRAARGSGRGLAGIAPATLHEGRTWFVRPLLATGRAELRAFLKARGQGWIDDPSNRDRRFERVRVRQDHADGGCDDAAVRDAFEARREASRLAGELIGDPSLWRFDGAARTAVLGAGFDPEADEARLALAAVLAWVGRSENLPSAAIAARAAQFCAQPRPGTHVTVAGCLLSARRDGIEIGREARNRRTGKSGFEYLLSSPDFALGQALSRRAGAGDLPAPPVSGYPV